MIDVRQWPEETTRTPERACYWTALATIDGVEYVGRSRSGAVHELARSLVAAGLSDDALRVETAGLAGHMTIGSFTEAARWTIAGNGQRVRWEDPAAMKARFDVSALAQNRGEGGGELP